MLFNFHYNFNNTIVYDLNLSLKTLAKNFNSPLIDFAICDINSIGTNNRAKKKEERLGKNVEKLSILWFLNVKIFTPMKTERDKVKGRVR